jgi:hypothetical protein
VLVESIAGRTFGRPPRPNVVSEAAAREAFIRSYSGDVIICMLGPNPTHESFRIAAYFLTDLAFQASGDEPLGWGEFMEQYTAMYPRGQPGLPDDPVTAYVICLCTAGAVLGLRRLGGAWTARRHDPTRECKVCVATASSSSSSEPAPHHRGADDQRRARLDELAEARRQLDEEQTLLHQEVGVEASHMSDNQRRACWRKAKPTKGMAIDAWNKTFLCRVSLVGRTATDVSASRLQTNRVVMHLRRPACAGARQQSTCQ